MGFSKKDFKLLIDLDNRLIAAVEAFAAYKYPGFDKYVAESSIGTWEKGPTEWEVIIFDKDQKSKAVKIKRSEVVK